MYTEGNIIYDFAMSSIWIFYSKKKSLPLAIKYFDTFYVSTYSVSVTVKFGKVFYEV